jgi:aryl-alcohol dehydrogenase-like predicted oxidoreductase
MVLRRLGRTGLLVSPIGFGAFKIGRNRGIKYPAGYELPDEAAVHRLLNGVLDCGVNYIDTAPAYGVSEERIGAALAHRRGEFVLSPKVGETFENDRSTYDFSAAAVRASVQRSLMRLKTDVLDVVFIHSHGDDLKILDETDAVATLHDLRDAGHVRAVGFSGKTVDGARAALAWADVLMVEYHLDDRSHEDVIGEAASPAIDAGVVIKKPLASGRLEPRAAIEFILSNANVASVIIGGLDLDHVRDNVAVADAM